MNIIVQMLLGFSLTALLYGEFTGYGFYFQFEGSLTAIIPSFLSLLHTAESSVPGDFWA